MKIIITENQYKRLFEEKDDLATSIRKIKELIDSGSGANMNLAFVMASMFGEDVQNEVLIDWINKFAEPYSTDFIFKKEYIGIIRELNMTHNQLSFLPDSIGKLVNLEILYLGDNQLSSLPDSIGKLTNLKRLDLSGNQLTSLPDSIDKLNKLEELYLNGNKISKEEIKKIQSLLPKTEIFI